jgi:hypothetical protein
MYRIASLIFLGLASLPSLAATDATEASPSSGQWSTIVAILDSSNNHYLLKTAIADSPAACMTELQQIAGKVNETGGVIWTTPDKKNMSYQKETSPPNYEYKQAKVLELRCVREPFEGELVSK